MEVWGRGRLYPSLQCHHQTESCIKVGSDESRFKVSSIVRDKAARQCPQTTTFEENGELEPKRNRTEVPLLTSLMPYRWAKPAHGAAERFPPSSFPLPLLQLYVRIHTDRLLRAHICCCSSCVRPFTKLSQIFSLTPLPGLYKCRGVACSGTMKLVFNSFYIGGHFNDCHF